MQDSSEWRVGSVLERLQRSREEFFALAHTLKGDQPLVATDVGFPHSRLMRAITGERGRMVLSGAGLMLTLFRPKILWGVARLAPALRPLVMRYLLPKLLGRR